MKRCNQGHDVPDSNSYCGTCGAPALTVVQEVRPGFGRLLAEGAAMGVGVGVGHAIGHAAVSGIGNALSGGGEAAADGAADIVSGLF